MDNTPAWVAAIAAVVAGGIVAWQSWETRKSAEASQAAAQAAQAAVVTANEALRLSRLQAVEAVKSRIDAAMPMITIHADTAPTWPPQQPTVFGGGAPNDLPSGDASRVLHLPRDSQDLISVRLWITVSNDSGRTVELTTSEFEGAPSRGDPPTGVVTQPIQLGPGQIQKGWFRVTRPLDEWAAILKEREDGNPGPQAEFTAVYIDPADSGAIDNWSVVVGGTPVERVPELEGGWRIIGDGRHQAVGSLSGMAAAVMPRERRYYLSRSRNLPLGDES